MKKHIPNLFTLGNLFCGTLAVIYALKADYDTTVILILVAVLFDFVDGFAARLLGVSGELGKQLDSLADMVTSGVVPGIVMFQLLKGNYFSTRTLSFLNNGSDELGYIGLLLTLAACYRLAKFNIDTKQSDSFIGLPTPAMSLFVVSLPIVQQNSDIEIVTSALSNTYALIGITFILSYLMNANLPLLALKFKSFEWKDNEYRFVLILISMILLIILKTLAIPLIIIAYILISLLKNVMVKNKNTFSFKTKSFPKYTFLTNSSSANSLGTPSLRIPPWYIR